MRIPQELKDALDKASEENRRSLTAEVVARLQSTFASTSHASMPPMGGGGSSLRSELMDAAARINELQGRRNTLSIVVNAYGGHEEGEQIRYLKDQLGELDVQIARLVHFIQSRTQEPSLGRKD